MDKNTLLGWVVKGWKPTVEQIKSWLNSYRHIDDAIPMSAVENLEQTLNSKANIQSVNDAIAQESTARSNADTILEENINTVDQDLSAEIQNRINADNQLLAGITNEATQRAQALIDLKSDILNGSPSQLDTLKEIAEALGNNPNMSATMMQLIGDRITKPVNPTAGQALVFNGLNWIAAGVKAPIREKILDSCGGGDYLTHDEVLNDINIGKIVLNDSIVCSSQQGVSTLTGISDLDNAKIEEGQYISSSALDFGTIVIKKFNQGGNVNTIWINKPASGTTNNTFFNVWFRNQIVVKPGNYVATQNTFRQALTWKYDSSQTYWDSFNFCEITYGQDIPCIPIIGNGNFYGKGNTNSSFIKDSSTNTDHKTNSIFLFQWDSCEHVGTGTELNAVIVVGKGIGSSWKLDYNQLKSINGQAIRLTPYSGNIPNNVIISQNYTYGLYRAIGTEDYSSFAQNIFSLVGGLIEAPYGLYALKGSAVRMNLCLAIKGDVNISGTISFNGNIDGSTLITMSGSDYSSAVINGNISANSIVFNGSQYNHITVGARVCGTVSVDGANVVMNGNSYLGNILMYGGKLSLNAIHDGYFYSAGGSTIINGVAGTGSDHGSCTIAGGDVLVSGQLTVGWYLGISGGSLQVNGRLLGGVYNANIINQTGGDITISGKVIQPVGFTAPLFTKSGGTLDLTGAKLITGSNQNPIKITDNTDVAKNVRIVSVLTNCNYPTNSIKNAYDGNSFAIVDAVGNGICHESLTVK